MKYMKYVTVKSLTLGESFFIYTEPAFCGYKAATDNSNVSGSNHNVSERKWFHFTKLQLQSEPDLRTIYGGMCS